MAEALARISKATGAYALLRNIWSLAKISINTKISIFKTNVLGVLLYGAESWNYLEQDRHLPDQMSLQITVHLLADHHLQ